MNTQVLKIQEFITNNYYGNKKNLDTKYILKMPIHKLCGLEVTCELIFYRSFYVDLTIESNKIYKIDEDGNTDSKRLYFKTLLIGNNKPLLEKDYTTIVENLNETMKNIKFNKYTGFYETENNELTPDIWCSILGCGDHIEYSFDKCCVCHDITKSITYNCCNKQLCYECWDKLPMCVCDECEDSPDRDCEFVGACGTAKCPLCRCSLATGNEFES